MACGDNIIINNTTLGYPDSDGDGTFDLGAAIDWNLFDQPAGTVFSKDANRLKIESIITNTYGTVEFIQNIPSTYKRYKIECDMWSDALNTFNHNLGITIESVGVTALPYDSNENIKNQFNGVVVNTTSQKYAIVFYFTSAGDKTFRAGVLSSDNSGSGSTYCYVNNITVSEICPLTIGQSQGAGSVTFTVSGGEGPYYYRREWDGVEGVTDGSGVTITGLATGTYVIKINDKRLQNTWGGILYNQSAAFGYSKSVVYTILGGSCTVSATTTIIDASAPGMYDGQITINATGLDGASSYILYYPDGSFNVNGPTTPNVYPGLPAGNYSIKVITALGQCEFELDDVIVGENAPVGAQPYIVYPLVNSLRFVAAANPDNCSVFQSHDNTLFADQYFPGVHNKCYYQRVNKCDAIALQWQSNYSLNVVELTNITTNVITEFTAAVVTLPVDYVLPTEYNIVEAELDLSTMSEGVYSARIYGEDIDLPDYELLGEPIYIKESHENTNVLKVSNRDQAYGIEYLTGIEHILRIPSRFWKQNTSGKRTSYLDSKIQLINLKEYVSRTVTLETFMLPPYLHENITLALSHDLLTVNNVAFQRTDDGYKVNYIILHPLQNGEVELQQIYFNQSNGSDTGLTATQGGFLEQNNGGLIKY